MTEKKFKSAWEKIYDRLKAEGKVTVLSDDEVQSINNHIDKRMERFRQDLHRKFKQSESDLHRIILNA